MALRQDLALIAGHIPPNARVLDVGCGDGALMAELRATKSVDARGLELDPANVARCVSQGLVVVQGDAEVDLADYPDQSFDYVILSETLQTLRRPDQIIDQLLRIGRFAFVSFPNFGHWRVRAHLLMAGRMPMTRLVPIPWYATPNIHHLTVLDFDAFVSAHGLHVEQRWFMANDRVTGAIAASWRAEHAIYLVRR